MFSTCLTVCVHAYVHALAEGFSDRLAVDFSLDVYMGHDHSLPGIESRGLMLGLPLARIVMRSFWP